MKGNLLYCNQCKLLGPTNVVMHTYSLSGYFNSSNIDVCYGGKAILSI